MYLLGIRNFKGKNFIMEGVTSTGTGLERAGVIIEEYSGKGTKGDGLLKKEQELTDKQKQGELTNV